MKYGIEVKIGERWHLAHPALSPPYSFARRGEAETMARVLYPEQFRQAREGVEPAVRVVAIEEHG